MAYVSLNDLVLKSDYVTKELDLISFNAMMATIQLYANQLKRNIEAVREETAAAMVAAEEARLMSDIYIGFDEPTDPNITYWGKLTQS